MLLAIDIGNTHTVVGLFKGDAVGRDVVLEPATLEDVCGVSRSKKRSFEIIYDQAV